MSFDIAWYEAISMEGLQISVIPLVFFSAAAILFAKGKARFITLSLILALVCVSQYYGSLQNRDQLSDLNDKVLAIYEASEQFPLFPRKEVEYLFKELSRAQQEDFSYNIGDLDGSPQALMLENFQFMSDDELTIYAKFIEHCYSPELVSEIWGTQLAGYPVHRDEARSALTYAEARSDSTKPECLGTTASLSFLK